MSDYLTHDLIIHLILFQGFILLVILSNIRLIHRSRHSTPPLVYPKVSILVPARDEEINIAGCIQSLLAQDYPCFEVCVLDDGSRDATRSILEQIASTQPKLKVLIGSSPPEGCLGKNWACAQLAQQAQGDLLFFTDADTLHQPQTLRAIVTAMVSEEADLLTGYPRQEMRTWGEKLLVPFFSWAVLCFIPLELAYRLSLPWLSNAVGQMMLFRREAYQAIGGHKSISGSIVDDLMLAKRIKAAELSWRVVRITDLITCRMYHNGREAFMGLTKNLFAAFDFRVLPFAFAFLWLAVMFWEPLVVLALLLSGLAPQGQAGYLAICIGFSLLVWLIPYLELGLPLRLATLYPITTLAVIGVAFQSLRLSLSGGISWKGRKINRPRWKWL